MKLAQGRPILAIHWHVLPVIFADGARPSLTFRYLELARIKVVVRLSARGADQSVQVNVFEQSASAEGVQTRE